MRYFIVFFTCIHKNGQRSQNFTVLGHDKFPSAKTLDEFIIYYCAVGGDFEDNPVVNSFINGLTEVGSVQDIYDFTEGGINSSNIKDIVWTSNDAKCISDALSNFRKENGLDGLDFSQKIKQERIRKPSKTIDLKAN